MLDEATSTFVASVVDSGALRPLKEMTPDELRGSIAGMSALFGAGPQMHGVEDHELAAPGGSFTIRVLTPSPDARAVLLYFHGGGWVTGSRDDFDALGRQLAERTSSVVLLVDYRLAPENPFPAAFDDARSALEWAVAHHPGLPVVVAGDSSGGNLAAALAQVSALDGGPAISLQVLVYPVLDADFDRASYVDPANNLLVDRDSMVWYWDQYAPDIALRSDPRLSPLRRADLAGQPPAVVITAEHDVLRDEGEGYADRLEEAGVPVTRRRFAGQMHGFFTLLNVLPGSQDGIDFVVAAINEHLPR